MKVSYPIPTDKIADFVEGMLVIENYNVKDPFVLPIYANGKPTLLFQTAKGKIRYNANHLTLFGQTTIPDKITITEDFTLIAYFFKPFTLTSLFGFSAHELTDNPIDLALLKQPATYTLQQQLLNAPSTYVMIQILNDFIFSFSTKTNADSRLIKYATELITENPSKEILIKVQKELCVTERTFQRLFEQKIGISPNQYRRVAQFDAAFRQLNSGQFNLFTDIAFNNSYADQSHFIRSFKEFTNLTPREYLKFARE